LWRGLQQRAPAASCLVLEPLHNRGAGTDEVAACPLLSATATNRRCAMTSFAKIIDMSSDSEKSFDDAIVQGIKRATETLENVKSAWVEDQEVQVRDGKIATYRVHLKVTFQMK
jgi:dodecin